MKYYDEDIWAHTRQIGSWIKIRISRRPVSTECPVSRKQFRQIGAHVDEIIAG